jgi:hypothetical protein
MDTASFSDRFTQKFPSSNLGKIFAAVLVVALLGGIGTGYILASGKGKGSVSPIANIVNSAPQNPTQDNQTFRDFAQGTVQKKAAPKKGQDYSEGTHLLIREGALPVALTSSVVDLSQYEGKKVKVYGETQTALKEGWLMDVGKVEVLQ